MFRRPVLGQMCFGKTFAANGPHCFYGLLHGRLQSLQRLFRNPALSDQVLILKLESFPDSDTASQLHPLSLQYVLNI